MARSLGLWGKAERWNDLKPEVRHYLSAGARLIGRRQIPLVQRHFYAAYYKDQASLSAATTDREAFLHFLNHGIGAGYSPSPLFDKDSYQSGTFVDWIRHGLGDDVAPTAFFNSKFYLETYPDVRASDMNAFEHYYRRGVFEERKPNPWFDPKGYEAQKADNGRRPPAAFHFLFEGLQGQAVPPGLSKTTARFVMSQSATPGERATLLGQLNRIHGSKPGEAGPTAGASSFFCAEYYRSVAGLPPETSETTLLTHFLTRGLLSGLSPTPLFDPDLYTEIVATSPALPSVESTGSIFLHWLKYGCPARIVPTLLFDEAYYVSKYKDVSRTGVWGFRHFAEHGLREGRDPHPRFSTRWYRECHELSDSALPPFLHYLLVGDALGFKPSPDFSLPAEVTRTGTSRSQLETVLRLQRPDRIKQRFEYGVLKEVVARAEAVEPLIGRSREYAKLTMPPYSSPIYAAAKGIRESLPDTEYENVVCIPHCRVGGASRVAGELCTALAATYPDERLLIVRTDLSVFERPDWFPDAAQIVDLRSFAIDVQGVPAQRLLLDVLVGVQARRIFNVNSRLAWEAFRSFGDRLSLWSELYAYMFCYDLDKLGKKTGYPIEFFEPCFDNLAGLILDNSYLRKYLEDRYCLTRENQSRILTLWSPVATDMQAQAHAARLRADKATAWRALWAGRLDRQKRFDIVIEIADRMPELEIQAWGHAVLDAGFSTDNLPPNLKFRGTFDAFDELPLGDADFWLYTSEWDGLPTILIDVGIRGMATVAARVGGTVDLIRDDTAWPVDDATVTDAYIDAITMLMSNPAEAAERGQALMELTTRQHSKLRYARDLREYLDS